MNLPTPIAKAAVKLSKHSPEILIGVGIVGIGASIVMACRATLKAKDELEKQQDEIDKFKGEIDKENENYKKDLSKLYLKEAVIVVKNYAPAVGITVLSVGCILKSHQILAKRNAALMAAYAGLESSFKEYRNRVKEAIGEDKEKELYLGKKTKELDVIDENGETIKAKNGIVVGDPSKISQYARFFDESSTQWSKSAEYNKTFLIDTQTMMNNQFKARGHMFLNEVYDALGLERSQAGAVVGWVYGAGDDFIDFGIYDVYTEPRRSAFINGYERSILLDFNVDGVIYDKI